MKDTLRSQLYLGSQNKRTSNVPKKHLNRSETVIIRQEINKEDRKVTSFNLSRVAKALELACSLGFPKILLNMDMATLATETQRLRGKTTAGTTSFHKLIREELIK